MSNRETILDALFARLTASAAFSTTGRRVKFPNQVPDQPALFLRYVGEEWMPRETRMPAKVVIKTQVWLYSSAGADPDATPSIALGRLIEAVTRSIQPPPALEAQTLGNLVTHCWVEGDIAIDPGDLAGQAVAVIPVKILVATFGR